MFSKRSQTIRQLLMSLCIVLAGIVLIWGAIVATRGLDWVKTGLRFYTEEGAALSLTWKVDGLSVFSFLF